MAEKTINYKLTKPDQDEYYDVGIFNDNADIIDKALADFDSRYKIGDIIQTVRKDLGDKWALCNGALIGDNYTVLQGLLNTQWTYPLKAGTLFCKLNGVYFKIDSTYARGDNNYSGATIYYTEKFANKATTWTKFYEGAFDVGDAYYIKGKYVFVGREAYSNNTSTQITAFTKEAGAAPIQKTDIGYVSSSSGESQPIVSGFNGTILAVPAKYYDSGSLTMAIMYTTDMDTLKNWKTFKASTSATSVTYHSIRYEGKYWGIYRSDGLYYSSSMENNAFGQINPPSGYEIGSNFCYINGLYYMLLWNTSDKSLYLCYSKDVTTLTANKVKIIPETFTADNMVTAYNGKGYSGLMGSTDTGHLYMVIVGKNTRGNIDMLFCSPEVYGTDNLPKAGVWKKLSELTTVYQTGFFNCSEITSKQTIVRRDMSYLPELPTLSPDHSYAYIKRDD